LKERSGNVYENKGSVFHRRMQSGNVIENKCTYALKAGMLLKTQHVRFLSPNSVQVVAHIFADSPFSTFDSRPSTASGRIQKAREVVAPWRFHLKRWRCLSSTPTIPFWSRRPINERFSPNAHSNWMILYCDEAVLVT